jgi:hypothetical protein
MKIEMTKGNINQIRQLIKSNLKYDNVHGKINIDDEDIVKIIMKSLNVINIKSITKIEILNK